METSLRYGGYSNSLRIHAKEKLPIDSNTYLQVLSFSHSFSSMPCLVTLKCIWKMRLKLGHFCQGNVSAFWLDFWVLYNLLLLLLFLPFFVRLNWNAGKFLDKVQWIIFLVQFFLQLDFGWTPWSGCLHLCLAKFVVWCYVDCYMY